MNILVTGAGGFIGKNLCARLKCIRDQKDLTRDYSSIMPLTINECVRETPRDILEKWCSEADFVFHLAGANRPELDFEFKRINVDFFEDILGMLRGAGNRCPVVLASSIQACLNGRFSNSPYGLSKKEAEKRLIEHSVVNSSKAIIYRLPNLFGKWSRPNYNTVVATFCYNALHDIPLVVNDSDVVLELLYIDEAVESFINALMDDADDELFRAVGNPKKVTVGDLADLIMSFRQSGTQLSVSSTIDGSLEKQLHATYLSFVDSSNGFDNGAESAWGGVNYPLYSHADERGSFTEFLKTPDRGQTSINVSRPGVTKGNHWHNTKWEKFLVVSGEAEVRLRKVSVNEGETAYPVRTFKVSGEALQVITMPPGYTHSITNISSNQDLITIIWCNECFDPARPDTYQETV